MNRQIINSNTQLSGKLTRTLIASAISSLLCTPAAFAQDAEAEKKSGTDAMLEQITVTSRKTEENLQDAPLSVTAFSGAGLEARGIENVVEVGSLTPNLTYQNNPGAGASSSVATVYIRGVGQRDFLGTIDNGVGFYIDDVYIARTVGANVNLLDIDRIEVLRGPQGTLFGRNNVGGALAIHTKKPHADTEAFIDVTLGTDSMQKFKVGGNVALTEHLFANIALADTSQDGYVERPAGGDLGDDNSTAGRASLYWEPSDDLNIQLTGDYSTEEENGPAFTLNYIDLYLANGFPGFYNNVTAASDCAYPGGLTSDNPVCYNNQWLSDDTNYGTAPTYSNTDTWGLNMRVNWQINDSLSFKSVTAFRSLDAEFARDADASPHTVTTFYDDFETEQFSQEFQLQGTAFNDKLDWITGLYYFDEDGYNFNTLNFAIATFDSDNDFTTTSQAVYLQGTYHLTEQLDLTLGVRYTDEEKTFDPVQTVGPNNIGIPIGAPILPVGLNERSTQETTPMANLAYHVNNDLMVYATYSEGFRSGGYVQRIFPPLAVVPEFDPEYVEAYEAGFKYNSGDLVLNGAGFFMDYTDIQVRTQNPGFVGFFEANVGNAEISGFELETKWAFAEQWFFEGGVGYTNAEYTSIDVEPPLVAIITTDSEFDHVPEWSVTASLARDFYFDGGSMLTARISGDYHTSFFNNPENTPQTKTPEVAIYNAALLWKSPDDTYAVDFGLKNLTDEIYINSGYYNPTIGTSEIILDRGRQWYASFRYTYY
ncbi:TonB-dependent receptor [Alteromonas sp. ZYF713]|nr:TonB-dependent receptor [Alteromonas sp. ZYF713]